MLDISEDRLQHTINIYNEHGEEKALDLLGLKQDTLRRYMDEAKRRGIEVTTGDPVKAPVIFVFDLENSPTMAAVWGMWKQNVNLAAIKEEWYMLSWSGKYLQDTEVLSDVLTPEEAVNGDDKRIMLSLWDHINNADILIGHNINQFDVLKMNTKFILNGIKPPSPYQTIDTLIAARKNFAFTSNKLDYLCQQFDVARKADNGGMKRWMGCMRGEPDDLLEMEKYNRQDVVATEDLYFAMRPYMKNHPNLGLYMENNMDVCYKCGSADITWETETYYYTNVNKYPVYRCNQCHSHGRSRFSAMTKDERKHITSPIAR